MAPAQRTFTLVPQAPGRVASPDAQLCAVRPMTSKQVQKAYKSANRGPKLSRAEKIKQEKAEQERIRKEFEKEKAAAKARAAREKKKEKELVEKQQKKKKGLPTANVRPSQDTIAWFVRGNGLGKKRGLGDEELNTVKEEETHTNEESAAPPRQLDSLAEEEFGDLDDPDFDGDILDDIEKEPGQDINQGPSAKTQESTPKSLEVTAEAQRQHPPSPMQREAGSSPKRQKTSFQLPPRAESPISSSPSPSSPPHRTAPPMSTQAILVNYDDFSPSLSQQARELEDEDDFNSSPPPAETIQGSWLRVEADIDDLEQVLLEEAAEESIIDELAHTSENADPGIEAMEPDVELTMEPFVPPSRRFFTSSGSHEVMSLALHRSRRTAALEEVQQKQRSAANMQNHRPKTAPAFAPSAKGRSTSEKTSIPAQNYQKVQKQNEKRRPLETPKTKGNRFSKESGGNKENIPPAIVIAPTRLPPASQESEYGGDWLDDVAIDGMI